MEIPPPRRAWQSFSQATAGLARAGEQKLVHRDIKPENILITKSGEVKVADFGLARSAYDGTGESMALTQVGMTLGTPLYMSPEQAEGRKLDPRSDIYSLGVTCYHLLAGTPPFEGETALAVAVKHLKSVPVPLKTLRPDLPDKLCEIVHTMLAKKPEERYVSASELLKELVTLQSELPAWKTGPTPTTGLLAETLCSPEATSPPRKPWFGKSRVLDHLLHGLRSAGWFAGSSGIPRPRPSLGGNRVSIGSASRASLPAVALCDPSWDGGGMASSYRLFSSK